MKSIKIEENLHRELKIFCVINKINIKDLIEGLLKKYLEECQKEQVPKLKNL